MLPGQLVSFILFLSKCYILSFKTFRKLVNSLTSFLDLPIVTIYFAEISGQNISSQTHFQVILLRFLGIGENDTVAQKSRASVLQLECHHHFLPSPLMFSFDNRSKDGPCFLLASTKLLDKLANVSLIGYSYS